MLPVCCVFAFYYRRAGGHVRASAAKGQIICRAKRSRARAKLRVEKCESIQQSTVGAACKNCGEAAKHLFCPLFNSPICALKHRLHMPSLASRPAAKGCPAAHGFSISNKNHATFRASAAFARYAGHHPLTAFFALGWPKSKGRSLRARDSQLSPLRSCATPHTAPCLTAFPSLHCRGTTAAARTA